MTLAMVQGVRRLARVAARPVMRALAAVGLMASLNACAIPPIVSVAKLAADGVLFASTGKTSTDHGLSMATGKDCATLRVLDREDVCQEVVVAQIEPVPEEVIRDRAVVEAMIATAPDAEARQAVAERALASAFRPHAASTVAGDAPAVALAALPRPVDPGSVRTAVRPVEPPKAAQVVASSAPSRAVRARPGLIKVSAEPPRPLATQVAVRTAPGMVVPKTLSPETIGAVSTEPQPPPERPGTLERLGLALRNALRFPR